MKPQKQEDWRQIPHIKAIVQDIWLGRVHDVEFENTIGEALVELEERAKAEERERIREWAKSLIAIHQHKIDAQDINSEWHFGNIQAYKDLINFLKQHE